MEYLLALVGILLGITAIMAGVCYKLLRKAKRDYEKAKDAVKDIVLSFNRQIRNEAEKIALVAYKMEALSSKSDSALKKADEAVKVAQTMEAKVTSVLEERDKMLTRLDEVDKKVCDVTTSQSSISAKITSLENQARQFALAPEPNVEAVIPIKRDKALAPLTETELSVLEMLTSEGPKTAPETKNRVKLSREHTARLMKKLYEGGYLERETGKIPFKYSVKKEMEKLLKKVEDQAS